jgi:hypothetical protein
MALSNTTCCKKNKIKIKKKLKKIKIERYFGGVDGIYLICFMKNG